MIASTVNVSSFFLPPVLINKIIKHVFFFNLPESKNAAACAHAVIHVYMHNRHTNTHVHTLLSGLLSSVKLPTASFIMLKRMYSAHGDSFTYTATELGPTLLVFLAIEKSFSNRICLIVSLGGAFLILALIS